MYLDQSMNNEENLLQNAHAMVQGPSLDVQFPLPTNSLQSTNIPGELLFQHTDFQQTQSSPSQNGILGVFPPVSQESLILNTRSPRSQSNSSIFSNNQFDDLNDKAKKKAQNRAAQKAFRERKEAKLKELQDQLYQSELDRQTLLREIDDLKKLNMKINAENKLLLENKKLQLRQQDLALSPPSSLSDESTFSFPTKDESFTTSMIHQFGNSITQKYPMDLTVPGIQLLSVPATWEYLSKLSEEQDLDIILVMKLLKRNHVCTEEGPSYPIFLINKVVSQVMNVNSIPH